VKNVFLTNERTWSRKLVEILLSLVIEKQMSKLDILHLYINKVGRSGLSTRTKPF
jgi:penicillin-binding protein 1A